MRYYDNLMLVLLGLSFVADPHIGRCLVMAWTWNHQTQLEDHQERAGSSEPLGRTAELEHRVRQIFDGDFLNSVCSATRPTERTSQAERIQPGMEHLFLMHDSDNKGAFCFRSMNARLTERYRYPRVLRAQTGLLSGCSRLGQGPL